MATPSKVMFSPNLRLEHVKKLEPLRRPQLPTQQEDEDDIDDFNPYLFMSQLPDHRIAHIPGKICLPPKSSHLQHLHTLVLDLDETLVHYNKYNNEYDVKLEVQQNDKNL